MRKRRTIRMLRLAGETLCVLSVASILTLVGMRALATAAMCEAAMARIEQAAR
jgi:hypothetical protein